jgi:hypothetical protein
LRMNAFCASENFDAFIALRSSQPRESPRKTLTKNDPELRAQSIRPVVWYRRQAGKQDGFADNKDGHQHAEKNLRDPRIGFGLF